MQFGYLAFWTERKVMRFLYILGAINENPKLEKKNYNC